MAISCPRCGADFDATLFEFGHRVRCPCGAQVGYPGDDLRSGHVLNDPMPPRKEQSTTCRPRKGRRPEHGN